MSKRDISLLLEDMLESAFKIRRYVNEMDFDSFIVSVSFLNILIITQYLTVG